MPHKPPLLKLAGVIFVMALLAIWVASMATPASEMTRLRNALIFSVGDDSDFNWTPGQAPQTFRQERGDVPAAVNAFAIQWQQPENWQTVVTSANALRAKSTLKGAIQSHTTDTLKKILSTGIGYCSDYTQVMNAVSYSQSIPIREWGMSFDGYGGWGHAFSEVYVEDWNKWVFIDIFNGFYVTMKDNEFPLSSLEFREALATPQTLADLQIERLDGKFGFKTDADALTYYERGVNEFYLWWANDSLTYDEHPLINLASGFGRPVEQLAALAVGMHPQIKALPLQENLSQRRAMERLFYILIGILIAEVILGLMACLYAYRAIRYYFSQKKN